MTNPTQEQIQAAVEVLRRSTEMSIAECDCWGSMGSTDGYCDGCKEEQAALAALDGLHIYASRFKVGDEVWWVRQYSEKHPTMPSKWYISGEHFHGVVIGAADDGVIVDATNDDYYSNVVTNDERNLFPTQAEAEAECKRRNEAKLWRGRKRC
jgi:hypothetical protein